jgi:outer membrane protein
MKHTDLRVLLVVAAITLFGLCAAHSGPAAAQQAAPVVIGIVDVEQIMQDSKAAKSIRAQFDQQKKAFEAEVIKQRKLFNDAKQKLGAQQSTMTQADFQKKVDDLSKQGAQIEKNLTQRQNQLEDSVTRSRNQVFDAMRLVAADVAKDRGLTLVIQKGATLVYDASTEITDDVLKRLDAKLPSVKLQQSSGTQGGAQGNTQSNTQAPLQLNTQP